MREMREMRDRGSSHSGLAFAAFTMAKIPIFKAVGRLDQESQIVWRSGSRGAAWPHKPAPSAPDPRRLLLDDREFQAFLPTVQPR
jgi:hypothetical protein